MEVVIDSNVLFRTIISRGDIVNVIFDPSLFLFAPEKLREEFVKHRNEILDKTELSEKEFNELVKEAFERIKFVPLNEYKHCIPKAKALLKEHIKDEDFVALSLSKNCKFWTYESLMFKLGIAISTKELSLALREELP